MSSIYLCIKRLRVESANAFTSGTTINPAPITAAVFFGHALSRVLDEEVSGVAYLHHDAQLLGERFKGMHFQPQQRRGAGYIDKNDYASTNKHALSLQPTASFHLTVSLIIRFDDEAEIDLNVVEQFLRGGRFAGGKIIDYAALTLLDPLSPTSDLPGGFWLIDRQDLLEGSSDHLGCLTHILSAAPKGDDHHPWLVLASVGYAAITEAKPRDYVRADYPHFFSEPMLGLVQFVSRRQYEKNRPEIPFWELHWPTPQQCLIQQSQD